MIGASRCNVIVLTAALVIQCIGCGNEPEPAQQGDLALRGGTPTIRHQVPVQVDDPATTNDESNDQPLGDFGTVTISITSLSSGNTYTLDADMNGNRLHRIYFVKGGWVDFPDCELDDDMAGECEDEEGRTWRVEGQG